MKIALLLVLLTTLAQAELTLAQLKQRAGDTKLRAPGYYLKAARAAQAVFQKQGGLVHLPEDVPTLVLPDLHAQQNYLVAALSQKIDGVQAFQLLKTGRLNLLCLGDAMHSEQRNHMRWLQAEQDYLSQQPSPALEAELVESLGLLAMILDLKVAYPQNFYFVRGNHEDMDPERPYTKFTRVGESNLVREWVLKNWGRQFLTQWSGCERSMPLLASGASFMASHAPPEREITPAEVEKRTSAAFRALCWSDNTQWSTGSTEEKAFLANCARFHVTPERPWIVGHRKVDKGLYRSQLEGRIIQINPIEGWVMLVAPPKGRPFESRKAVRPIS